MSETAARSDLMALANKINEAKPSWLPISGHVRNVTFTLTECDLIVSAIRLAASQPDREAIKASLRELDTLIREYDVTNSDWAFRSSVMLTEVAKILSLLSGAGTKSDGGAKVTYARKLVDDPNSASGKRLMDVEVKPAPSDPSPGPDVRRRVLDILNAVAPAVENLAGHQEQCDMDGVMVKVSRQALDEVLNAVNEVALVSALTRPLGGSVLDSLRARARPIETAPREADEVLLISFQEQSDGSTYVSAHTGCWSEDIQMWVLGPRGSVCNSTGDGVSTHWIPLP